MNKKFALFLVAMIPAIGFAQDTVKPVVAQKASPFPLESVRLLDGPFLDAMETDAAYLFALEPDRLLHGFLREAGLEPRAPVYGGWESLGVAGHTLGHYISALSMYHAASGNPDAASRITYIVDELRRAQNAWGDGFVAAIPEGREMFDRVSRGDIETSPFRLNGGWAPWYVIHKQLAGLIDAWRYTKNPLALQIAVDLADWSIATTSSLSPELWQKMLACEHGGMNESLADLYAITGNEDYLTLSRKFHHLAVLGPLADHIEILDGLHSNTQIPKIIGVTRQYELIGDDSLKTVADFFWDSMTGHHTYAIGGNSYDEHLGPPDQLAERLGATTAETCNTYNMLRLTRQLFTLSPQSRYADFYERALYNHILASQEPETGMFTYYMSLKPGHFKTYSTPENAFWCCVGSGIENHVKYGDSIYFHDENGIWINLFVASEVKWRERNLSLRQETTFPDENGMRMVVSLEEPTTLALRVRHPSWTQAPLEVSINGSQMVVDSTPGSYLVLEREWQDGDVVDVHLPMHLRLESMPDKSSRSAILYGPIVLAGALGTADMPKNGAFADSDVEYAEWPTPSVPVLVGDTGAVSEWIKPLAGDPLTFHTLGAGRPNDVVLKPFFRTNNERYTVYWDFFRESEWAEAEISYRAEENRKREIEANTIDVMRFGEMLGEESHNFTSENSEKGLAFGRRFRVANSNGWFSFDMALPTESGAALHCTYWSVERGDRTFTISVDGTEISREHIENDFPERFIERTYAIPEELISGKESALFRFDAGRGQKAGRVFSCRILGNQ